MEDKIYWIWLSLAAGPSSTLPRKLTEYFGTDIRAIYNADDAQYRQAGATPKNVAALSNKSLAETENIISWCNAKRVRILTYDDPLYPDKLKAIPDWPPVLYYIGEFYRFDSMLSVGAVGTRQMTKYGHDTTYSVCYDLAKSGAVVVSGLAAGIDTASHRAALDAGGKTCAVIGTRIDKVYPIENREIMREIARKCLLITEFHPFSKTSPRNFPMRNRIISALSDATVVFEADLNSGSLITADLTLKHQRKLFAVPGKVGEQGALGTNKLIRDGADMAISAKDILKPFKDKYSLQYSDSRIFDSSRCMQSKDSFKKKPKEEIIPITDELQKKLYAMLSVDTPVSAETLVLPGYTYKDIITALTMLELSGYLKQHPGNMYTKK